MNEKKTIASFTAHKTVSLAEAVLCYIRSIDTDVPTFEQIAYVEDLAEMITESAQSTYEAVIEL